MMSPRALLAPLLVAAVAAAVLAVVAEAASVPAPAAAPAAGPVPAPNGIGPRALLCYIANWLPKFKPKSIEPDLCDILLVAFGRLAPDGTLTGPAISNDTGIISLGAVAAIKSSKKSSAALGLSIGGWGEGSERFSSMSADPKKRRAFVESVVTTVKRFDLKAVELAWISPTNRGGKQADFYNYNLLVEDMARALRPLGVAVGVALPVINDADVLKSIDVATISKLADWMLVQGYDLHGHWDPYTDVNAPINSPRPGDTRTVGGLLKMFLDLSPASRLVLGMPAFGRTWVLSDSPVPGGVGAKAEQGSMFSDSGMLAYNEICPDLHADEEDERKLVQARDPISKTPFAVTNRFTRRGFVSFEDAPSIRAKVNLALDYGLEGVGLFTIDNDDYAGECGEPYPLLKAAKEALKD